MGVARVGNGCQFCEPANTSPSCSDFCVHVVTSLFVQRLGGLKDTHSLSTSTQMKLKLLTRCVSDDTIFFSLFFSSPPSLLPSLSFPLFPLSVWTWSI